MKIVDETSRHLIAFCPFHEDKNTPNLKINKGGRWPGHWRCFACGVKGKIPIEEVKRLSKTPTYNKEVSNVDWYKLQGKFVNNMNEKFGVEMPLTQGLETIVDVKNYGELSKWSWCVKKKEGRYYAGHFNRGEENTYLHQLIAGVSLNGKEIDHVNRDSLDNRLSNLRQVTRGQNIQNSIGWGQSKYRGVFFTSQRTCVKKWGAAIYLNGKRVLDKFFNTEMEAAKAYDEAAIKHYGEFAYLNFPRSKEYRLKDLSIDWNVSITALRNSGIGWNKNAFTVPMFSENEEIIGIQLRNKEGRKWSIEGSQLGIFRSCGNINSPIIVAEGWSDMVVAAELGFSSIGKPSASYGELLIKKYLDNKKYSGKVLITKDLGEAGEKNVEKIRNILTSDYECAIIEVGKYKDLRHFYLNEGKEKTINLLKGIK